MRYTVTQFAGESVGLCPFWGLYLTEFELSHSNPVNRITEITHAHNLHVTLLDFVPFKISTQNNTNCSQENLLKRFFNGQLIFN